MPGYTYSAMNRIPESERVRIGFRYRDGLERYSCRTCGQKVAITTVPFMACFVYFREYQIKYGTYPILRAGHLLSGTSIRQKVHYALPIALFSLGMWWAELSYNRCVLGIQGAQPLPDQIIKRSSFP